MAEQKLIWFKKAKCAGSSFESLLQDNGAIYYVDQFTTRDELEDPSIKVICIRGGMSPGGNSVYRARDGAYLHRRKSKLSQFLGSLFEPKVLMLEKFPDILESYHKFAIVRNPYDKFVSSWKYLKSTRDFKALQVLENLPSKKSYHDWLHLTKRQVDYVYDGDNCLVDEIVYMEQNFQKALDVLLTTVGLRAEDLPHRNVTRKGSNLGCLDHMAIAKIYEIYHADFTAFGYSQDPKVLAPIFDWNTERDVGAQLVPKCLR